MCHKVVKLASKGTRLLQVQVQYKVQYRPAAAVLLQSCVSSL